MNSEQSLDRSNTIKDEQIEKIKKAIRKGVRESQKILVFGHPGVGKTYLIKNMMEQYSQDVTKRWIYYHLSELVISSNNQIYEQFESLLLQQQNESQQYIVVFDEIDVLYDPISQFKRMKRMKEIMIRLLSQSKIGIIALTNRPNRIPSQILQRLASRIMIDLPNNDLRSKIIIRQLSNIPNELNEEDIKQLSLLTQLYTFSDLMLVMRQLSYHWSGLGQNLQSRLFELRNIQVILSSGVFDHPSAKKPWLHQQAILALPQIKAFLTHCGWGSICQSIVFKTPIICVPVFADQPKNAKLAVLRKIGVQIFETTYIRCPAIFQPQISDQQAFSKIKEVMENPIYQQNIERMNKMNKFINATESICKIVYETLNFGHQHLINDHYEKATIKTGVNYKDILSESYKQIQDQKFALSAHQNSKK